jgi:hypothetical protein
MLDASWAAPFQGSWHVNFLASTITGLSMSPKPAGGNHEGSNNNDMPFKASLYKTYHHPTALSKKHIFSF